MSFGSSDLLAQADESSGTHDTHASGPSGVISVLCGLRRGRLLFNKLPAAHQQNEQYRNERLEVNEGPGSGVRVLNSPVLAPFRESIRCAEQNLYARAQQLVGDRDPRSHEFSVQLRGFDAAKSGAKTGVGAVIALSSALLKKSVRGGLFVVGEVSLGGTIEPVHNAVNLAEIAIEKGAKSLLLPVACRRQLFELSDEMATKLDIEFYQDARDSLLKALVD